MMSTAAIQADQSFARYCDKIAVERVMRPVETQPLIHPISDTGRYQISAIVPGRMDITYCDDLEVARATLAPFIASHREDANAQAGIYDMRAFRTVDSFRGGQVFGPRDTRHPLERIFGRLIAKGDPVTIIDPRGIRTFNDADNRRDGEA